MDQMTPTERYKQQLQKETKEKIRKMREDEKANAKEVTEYAPRDRLHDGELVMKTGGMRKSGFEDGVKLSLNVIPRPFIPKFDSFSIKPREDLRSCDRAPFYTPVQRLDEMEDYATHPQVLSREPRVNVFRPRGFSFSRGRGGGTDPANNRRYFQASPPWQQPPTQNDGNEGRDNLAPEDIENFRQNYPGRCANRGRFF